MTSRTYGEPPFRAVAVHGGPGAPGSVSSLARALQKLMGTLEPLQSEMTVAGQVEELGRQIEAQAVPPVYIFGHSWGAWLTYLVAHRFPDLVKKAFLISSGAFDASHLPELNKRRHSRLTETERLQYDELPTQIEMATGPEKEALLARLGELAGKADNYCVDETPENREEGFSLNAAQYQSIWIEASRMRKEGYFRNIASGIRVPIRIIHGDNDPTPIQGVVEPIKNCVEDLKWYEIPKCGHDPWKERYGKEEFWRIVRTELFQ